MYLRKRTEVSRWVVDQLDFDSAPISSRRRSPIQQRAASRVVLAPMSLMDRPKPVRSKGRNQLIDQTNFNFHPTVRLKRFCITAELTANFVGLSPEL